MKKNRFIPGIYNECDRWCEYCKLTHHCFLYAKEKERMIEHLKKGEDPNDWNVLMKDVEDSLKEAMELIKKEARERGIDIDNLPDVKYEEPDPTKHPLFKSAEKYRKLSHKFLERLKRAIQEEGIDLSQKIEILPSPEEKAKNFRSIIFCYEVILWYHTLVPAKIYRALSQREYKSDALKSARVAYLGLVNSCNALLKIYQWDKELQDEILSLLIESERIKKDIDRFFPEHHKIKIPGRF